MPPAPCGLLGSLEGYTRSLGGVHRTATAGADRRVVFSTTTGPVECPRERRRGGQRTRTDRQVTQPSSFSNSEMSTATTR